MAIVAPLAFVAYADYSTEAILQEIPDLLIG